MKTLLSRGSSSKHEDEVLDIESQNTTKLNSQPVNKSPQYNRPRNGSCSPHDQTLRGQINGTSRSALQMVEALCGNTHKESRQIAQQFQRELAKSYMSYSKERAEELANRNNENPILNKYDYSLDSQVVKDCQMNPLLVKKRPENTLELSQELKLNIETQEQRLIGSASASPDSKQGVRKTSIVTEEAGHRTFNSFGLHSVSEMRNLPKQNSMAISSNIAPTESTFSTDVAAQQLQLQFIAWQMSNESGYKSKKDILKGREELYKAFERHKSACRANEILIREELIRTTNHQRVIARVKKSQIVQSEIKKQQQHSRSNLPLPSSCDSMLKSTAFVGDIRNLITEEHAQMNSATKQLQADRRVRSIAKRTQFNSQQNIAQDLIPIEKTQQSAIKSFISQKQKQRELDRADSARMKRKIRELNSHIKYNNLQSIYKIKLSATPERGEQIVYREHLSSVQEALGTSITNCTFSNLTTQPRQLAPQFIVTGGKQLPRDQERSNNSGSDVPIEQSLESRQTGNFKIKCQQSTIMFQENTNCDQLLQEIKPPKIQIVKPDLEKKSPLIKDNKLDIEQGSSQQSIPVDVSFDVYRNILSSSRAQSSDTRISQPSRADKNTHNFSNMKVDSDMESQNTQLMQEAGMAELIKQQMIRQSHQLKNTQQLENGQSDGNLDQDNAVKAVSPPKKQPQIKNNESPFIMVSQNADSILEDNFHRSQDQTSTSLMKTAVIAENQANVYVADRYIKPKKLIAPNANLKGLGPDSTYRDSKRTGLSKDLEDSTPLDSKGDESQTVRTVESTFKIPIELTTKDGLISRNAGNQIKDLTPFNHQRIERPYMPTKVLKGQIRSQNVLPKLIATSKSHTHQYLQPTENEDIKSHGHFLEIQQQVFPCVKRGSLAQDRTKVKIGELKSTSKLTDSLGKYRSVSTLRNSKIASQPGELKRSNPNKSKQTEEAYNVPTMLTHESRDPKFDQIIGHIFSLSNEGAENNMESIPIQDMQVILNMQDIDNVQISGPSGKFIKEINNYKNAEVTNKQSHTHSNFDKTHDAVNKKWNQLPIKRRCNMGSDRLHKNSLSNVRQSTDSLKKDKKGSITGQSASDLMLSGQGISKQQTPGEERSENSPEPKSQAQQNSQYCEGGSTKVAPSIRESSHDSINKSQIINK